MFVLVGSDRLVGEELSERPRLAVVVGWELYCCVCCDRGDICMIRGSLVWG